MHFTREDLCKIPCLHPFRHIFFKCQISDCFSSVYSQCFNWATSVAMVVHYSFIRTFSTGNISSITAAKRKTLVAKATTHTSLTVVSGAPFIRSQKGVRSSSNNQLSVVILFFFKPIKNRSSRLT